MIQCIIILVGSSSMKMLYSKLIFILLCVYGGYKNSRNILSQIKDARIPID